MRSKFCVSDLSETFFDIDEDVDRDEILTGSEFSFFPKRSRCGCKAEIKLSSIFQTNFNYETIFVHSNSKTFC